MFSMGVGVLVLMGVGFVIVALPLGILWLVFRGAAALLGLVAIVLGGLWRGSAVALRGLGSGMRSGFGGLGAVIVHVFRFVRGMLGDVLRFAGGLLTAIFLVPLLLFNAALLRGRTARHYAGAIEDELASLFLSCYRLAIGHPARFLGLSVLTEGFERRIPDIIAKAPGSTGPVGAVPKGDTKAFPGYKVLGTLQSGGSGGRLFLAAPSDEKRAQFQLAGHTDPGRVVIKSFALEDGSTLPQIVRESRALEAAKQLGYVLEHELSQRRFHYVMPFVDGDELSTITRRMHAASSPLGLDDRHLRHALDYAEQLFVQLDQFHRAGLWHKDIKPSNILVASGRLHLVDLGLVTPLQSAMTLTTHGTEYFRDPEMVRLAMRGVKVHEVDGVKFDLYSAGAVLFALLENSFPAHGSLSQITKRAPDALTWIVRRAMADLAQRYNSAGEALRDVRSLAAADDPFAVRPADLPSYRGVPYEAPAAEPDPFRAPQAGPAAIPPAEALASLYAFARERAQSVRSQLFAERDKVGALASQVRQGARNVHAQILAERDKVGTLAARLAASRAERAPSAPVAESAPAAAASLARVPQTEPSVRRRRRVGRGVAVAAGLLACWIVGAAVLSGPGSSHHAWAIAAPAPDVTPQVVVNGITAALARHAKESVPAVLVRAEDGRDVWVANSADLPSTALVLCDLTEPLPLAALLHDQLALQNYRVLGLSELGLGAFEEDEVELVARARMLGLSGPGDPAAAGALEALVHATPGLDCVIWLAGGETGDPETLLVGRGLRQYSGAPQPRELRVLSGPFGGRMILHEDVAVESEAFVYEIF